MEGKDFEKTASLLTAAVALTSCSTVPIQKPEMAEPVPLIEPMPTEEMPSNDPETEDTTNAADILTQPTMIPESMGKEVDFFHQTDAHEDNHIKESKYVISITDGQISTEEAEDDGVFNEEILDIFNWKESGMEVEEVKRNLLPKTVEITKPTNIFTVDLGDNGFVMKGIYAFLEKSTVTGGTLEILDEKIIISEKGGSVRLGILPYEGKVKQIQAIILEAMDPDGTKEEFVKTVEDSNTAKEPVVKVSTEKHAIDEEILELTSYIYNPEDLARVEEYIEYNKTIESIISLKESLDSYPDNSTTLLHEYLQETQWYQERVEDVGPEAMREVVKNLQMALKIAKQPLQCVTFNKLMRHAYPELNIPEVRTNKKGYAKEIATHIFAPSNDIKTVPLWYGANQITGSDIPIDTYAAGDVFVTIGGEYGHTGVIVGKYTDGQGEPFLLVADSNRTFNGRIRLFVVDRYNIGSMLDTDYMFIIRSK